MGEKLHKGIMGEFDLVVVCRRYASNAIPKASALNRLRSGGAVSPPPSDPGQGPGRGPGSKAPGSS